MYACVRLQIRTGGEKPIRSPTRRQSRISKSKVTLSPENNKTTLRLTLFRVFRVFRGLFVYLTLPYSQQPTKTHIKPHVPTSFFLTLRNCTFSATIHSPPSTALQLSTAVYTYLQLKRSYSQFEFPSLHLIQTRLLRNYGPTGRLRHACTVARLHACTVARLNLAAAGGEFFSVSFGLWSNGCHGFTSRVIALFTALRIAKPR